MASVVYCVMMRLEEGVNHFNPPGFPLLPQLPERRDPDKYKNRSQGHLCYHAREAENSAA
jgi:hypothetical protein